MIKNFISSLDIIKEKCVCTVKTNPFFVYYGCWLILLSFILISSTKYDSFVFINHHRSFIADVIFTIFTDLGNGYILIPLALLFIFKKNYQALTGILAGALISTLIVSWLKHSLNHPRPLTCYGKSIVETARWITLYKKYSFPSGHTVTAFCIAAYLSLSFSRDKYTIFISFIGAFLTGYSRIYLGEHFLEDVFAGSILGVLMAVITFIFVQYLFSRLKKQKNFRE